MSCWRRHAQCRPRTFEPPLAEGARAQLEGIAASRSLPAGLVRSAEAILLSAAGLANREVRARVDLSAAMVGHWRRRYRDLGLAGLYDAPRTGRPRKHDDDEVARWLRTVLRSTPPGATHWSTRSAAAKTGIGKSAVQRYFALFGVQPHRTKTFRWSTDSFFIAKVRDIVGLYLNPPDHALVLAVDEKSQIQALERTAPLLAMGLGYVEGVTHDYRRHGTTTLFVALDVHVILDNYATHKHVKVRAWLARRPRYHVHYTPTYSSWLNHVERWFGLITQRAIRRGAFRPVRELIERIEAFVALHNRTAAPFAWTATADSILQKIARFATVVSGTRY